MASQPGSDELAALREEIKSGIANLNKKLEDEAVKLRNDVHQARLARAENYATYMRNWLALLTFTVSAAFIAFGLIGYTRFSDVETYRKQMASDAADVSKNAKIVSDAASTVQHVMGDLQTKVAGFDVKVADLDKRIDGVESRSAEAEARNKAAEKQMAAALNSTSAVAQQTRNSLQSGLISGDFAVNVPFVSQAYLAPPPAVSAISGRDFGSSPGRVYIEVQHGIFIGSVTYQLPITIEIDPPFTWSDTSISFVLSTEIIQRLKDIHEKESASSTNSGITTFSAPSGLNSSSYLTVRVANADGRSSISLATVSWP